MPSRHTTGCGYGCKLMGAMTKEQADMRAGRGVSRPDIDLISPEELLLAPGLSRKRKAELLYSWAYDASENCVALEEGMRGEDDDLLRRILLALNDVTDGIDVEHVGPTKQHSLAAAPNNRKSQEATI